MNADSSQALIDRLLRGYRLDEVVRQKPGLTLVRVERQHTVSMLRTLRDDEGFSHLNFLTAIDYIERGVFRLTYMLHNYVLHEGIAVHVDIAREAAEMDSIHPLWAQAATYQRELREMYGIRFPGSPRLDDDFCLEGWDQIPPMRREFDTLAFAQARFGDREGRASEDPRAHMHEALYPTRGGDR